MGSKLEIGGEYVVRARALGSDGAGVANIADGGGGSVEVGGGVSGFGVVSAGVNGPGTAGMGGYVIFVRGLLPGELARVRLTDVRSSYARGELLELAETSADRITPECGYFGKCGGCAYMHMSYGRELEYKRRHVADALRRIAGLADVDVKPVVGCWNESGIIAGINTANADASADTADYYRRYRNKGQYAYDGESGKFGFFETGTHNFIEISDCLLQKSRNREFLAAIEKWGAVYPELAIGLKDVVIRTSETAGGTLVILNYIDGPDVRVDRIMRSGATGQKPINGGAMPFDGGAMPFDGGAMQIDGGIMPYDGGLSGGLKNLVSCLRDLTDSVIVNLDPASPGRGAAAPKRKKRTIALYGSGSLDEALRGFTFRVSHDAFFQVNTKAAELLYATVLDFADAGPSDRAVDFYCGAGTISACLARRAGEVIGVETSGSAIKNARENAVRNKISNLTFIEGRAEWAAASLARDGYRPDVVIVDPPRAGCSPDFIKSLLALGAPRIVYVSCDPATLCRDAARLISAGGSSNNGSGSSSSSGSGSSGYLLAAVQPVDMFPRTSSIETVALFTKI